MQSAKKNILASLVEGQLWTLHTTGNRFLSIVEVYNNALIVKTTAGLVLINPPSSTPNCIEAVRQLAKSQRLSVCTLFSPGDWHHFHLQTWANAFPDAELYVASPRVLKKQPSLKGRAVVLSRESPSIPVLAATCRLLPWLGSKQPPWILGGDRKGTDRVEHLVFHLASQTLFITDHVMGPGVMGAKISANKGGFSKKSGSSEALKASAKRVLDCRSRRIVFSHGKQDAFVVGDGTPAAEEEIHAQLTKAYRFFGL